MPTRLHNREHLSSSGVNLSRFCARLLREVSCKRALSTASNPFYVMCIDLAFQAWENSLEKHPFTLQKSILFQYTRREGQQHIGVHIIQKRLLDNARAAQKADSFNVTHSRRNKTELNITRVLAEKRRKYLIIIITLTSGREKLSLSVGCVDASKNGAHSLFEDLQLLSCGHSSLYI